MENEQDAPVSIISIAKKRKINKEDVSNTHEFQELQAQHDDLQEKYLKLKEQMEELGKENERKQIIINEMRRLSGLKTVSIDKLDHYDVRVLLYIEEKGLLVSAGNYNDVKIWSVSNNKCLQTLKGHESFVRQLIYLKDTEQLLSGSWDSTIRVWSLSNETFGYCMHILEGHTDFVNDIVHIHDQQKVVTASRDNTLKIWSVDDAAYTCLYTLEGHTASVNCVIDIGNDKIVSASKDTKLKLWSLASGECLQTLQGHSESIWSMIYLPDKMQIVTGSKDCSIKIWSLADDNTFGDCIDTLKGRSGFHSLMYLADKEQLVSTNNYGINTWSLANGPNFGKCLMYFDGDTVIYVPTRDIFISGGNYNIKLWSASSEKKECIETIETDGEYVKSLLYIPETNKIFSSFLESDYVHIWSSV